MEEYEYDCEEDGILYYDRKTPCFPDGYEEENMDTWQECQKKCAKDGLCKEFTWHKESSNQAKYCLMFSAHKGKEQNNATVSGPQKCPGKNVI